MTYYSKNNAYPIRADQLPEVEASPDGRLWTHLVDNEDGLIACGYVAVVDPPTHDPNLQELRWVEGEWVVSNIPTPEPTPIVIEVSHKEFSDLLTFTERTRITGIEKKIAAQTEAEFLAPQNLLYQYFNDVNSQFTKASRIQLTHPDTINAINNVLLPLQIFDGATPEIRAARAARVLANLPPLPSEG